MKSRVHIQMNSKMKKANTVDTVHSKFPLSTPYKYTVALTFVAPIHGVQTHDKNHIHNGGEKDISGPML